MSKPTNRWDRRLELLVERARQQSDAVAEQIRGGDTPPGQVRLPKTEQLRQYLLLAQPVESLTAEQAAEADRLWQATFAQRSRADIAEYCLHMERLRQRLGGPTLEAPEPSDLPEQEELLL